MTSQNGTCAQATIESPSSIVHEPCTGRSSPQIEEKTSEESAIESNDLGGAALRSQHMASILCLLDGARVDWPVRSKYGSDTSGADATTTIASNLTGNDDRESTNSILSVDGSNEPLQNDEVQRLSIDMEKLRRVLDAVTKERDILKERELEHSESMKILKQEINTLTLARISSPSAFSSELEHLRVENELFAAQIIENEVEIREIRTVLECLDTENRQMRSDLEAVRGQVAEDKSSQKVKADPESSVEAKSLEHQIQDLNARFAGIEFTRDFLEELFKREASVRSEEIKALKLTIDETKAKVEQLLSSQTNACDLNCEGIEVTVDGFVGGDIGGRGVEERRPTNHVFANESATLCGPCDCCQFMAHDD